MTLDTSMHASQELNTAIRLEVDHQLHTSGGYAFLMKLFKRIHWWFPVNAARPSILHNSKNKHLSEIGMSRKAFEDLGSWILINKEKGEKESTNPWPVILTELFTIILLINEQTLSSSWILSWDSEEKQYPSPSQ